MDHTIIQESDGRKGGLMMAWRKEFQIYRLDACSNYIDVRIVEDADKEWRFTGIYGEFKWQDKYKTWDRIRSIHHQNTLP
jgi:hypothetical protein